jgi:hypothetical protein
VIIDARARTFYCPFAQCDIKNAAHLQPPLGQLSYCTPLPSVCSPTITVMYSCLQILLPLLLAYYLTSAHARVLSLPSCTPDAHTSTLLNTSACLRAVRSSLADTRLFWFGAHWQRACRDHQPDNDQLDAVKCYNPPSLHNYHSIGARLLRVSTWSMEYVRTLTIVPTVVFRSEPGMCHFDPPYLPHTLLSIHPVGARLNLTPAIRRAQ